MNTPQFKNFEAFGGLWGDTRDALASPLNLHFSQRRAWPRKAVKIWGHCSNLRQSFLSQVCDVSEQGIALVSSVCPPMGTYLNLSFKLPGPTVRSMHRGVVIRHFENPLQRQQTGEGRGFVLELLDATKSEHRRRLRDFLAFSFAHAAL